MIPTNPSATSRPAKIQGHHLERLAIDYIRQSHPQQVQRHKESAQVQARLKERALAWGWPDERILVLDGDQGRSGTTVEGRKDFAWMVSEIVLGHVGLVLCFQINRLAREDEECCRLIKACAAFDTLLADEDGLYHPHDFNDRLILTIKGFMGGIELHQIQQRMQSGRLNRCRRGEWLGQTPPGYVVGPDHKLRFDPDEQAQSVTRLVLEQFAVTGSVSGVARYLRREGILLPTRPVGGPERGQLRWREPHRETLRQLLRNPAYAGTYAWGRFAIDPRRARPGSRGVGRVRREPQDCPVLIPDNHPAYLTQEQYEANLTRLKLHRRRGPVPGPSRATTAILAGLVTCGECGYRMHTHYTRSLRYVCQRRSLDYGAPPCQSLAGEALERLVSEQVLEVMTPAGLELSLRAAQERDRDRAAQEGQWRLRLERAAQDVDRAFRQYDAVEPENRLVARTLERDWEKALTARRNLEEDYHRFQQARPARSSATERERIEALARDLPTLWRASTTSVDEKRQIARILLEQVLVWAPATTQEVRVRLRWTGGVVTEHQVTRSVRGWDQVADAKGTWERVRGWQAAGWTSGRMAEELNATGHRTPHCRLFTAESVRQLLARGKPRVTPPAERANGRKSKSREKASSR